MNRFSMGLIVGIAFVSTAGCSEERSSSQEAARVEQSVSSQDLRGLGVTRLAFTEREDHLEIRGLDAGGHELARLALQVGRFVMTEDDRGEVDGRQLGIEVLGQQVTHESEGRYELTLPIPRAPSVAALLGDAAVAEALARHGIGFELANADLLATDQESPYEQCPPGTVQQSVNSNPYGSCGTCIFQPGTNCGSTDCKQFYLGGHEYGEYRCCGAVERFVERRCTNDGDRTGCGLVGGNGCAVCWYSDYTDGCNTYNVNNYCTGVWCQGA